MFMNHDKVLVFWETFFLEYKLSYENGRVNLMGSPKIMES